MFEDNSRTLAIERRDSETQHGRPDHIVTLNFSCSTLNARGRGFIEVPIISLNFGVQLLFILVLTLNDMTFYRWKNMVLATAFFRS